MAFEETRLRGEPRPHLRARPTSGGTIEVERAEGVGTTMRVKLPPYEPTLDARSAGVASRA